LKLIVIKDTRSKPKTFNFSARQIKLILVSLFTLPCLVGLAASGLWYNSRYLVALEDAPQGLVEYQQQLSLLREEAEQTLNAYAKRMGTFQAQVSRIEAVAERLAEQVGLDIAAFQFDDEPGVGGASPDLASVSEKGLLAQLRRFERSIFANARQYEALGYLLSDNVGSQSREPSGWPVANGWISSAYGSRTNPVTGKRQFHRGIDVPGRKGADIVAVADGVVSQSGYSGNYGWTVELNHGDGVATQYSHNMENLVEIGDTVRKGQVIAILGSTGRSTGPHVHFEVKQSGKTVNPYQYIKSKT
jgi:murein DD-endopeptidase MepM/ murein hydrolase activator NlpD